MKKQIIAKGIVCMLTIIMIVPVIASAQSDESFTISGEVKFKKTGNIHLELLTEEQFKADDDDDDDENASEEHESVSNLIFEIGEKELEQKKVTFEFTDIPPGIYVIQGFQDVNGNGKLDEGMFGPKEPWGMSMLTKKPKFRGPKLEEVKFEVTQDITNMVIEVK
jgi:uncharacterized protein (DUF2141 family)